MTSCSLPLVAKPFTNRVYPYPISFTLLSSNSIVFFKAPFSLGSTLKEQILSFKNEPSFGRDKLCREANKEPQKSFLIVEMEKKKHGDIHYTFTRLTKLKRRACTVLSGVTVYFGHRNLIRRFHRIF